MIILRRSFTELENGIELPTTHFELLSSWISLEGKLKYKMFNPDYLPEAILKVLEIFL
jgi:hypothetical protein